MPPPTDSASIIEVTDLVKFYGSRKILKHVNLTVNRGEIMVIMGGSGSGKSTLLRHLIGLESVSAGRINLLGQNICQMSEQDLAKFYRKLGVAFQGGALFSSMTVGENIMLPAKPRERPEKTGWRQNQPNPTIAWCLAPMLQLSEG